MEKKKVLILCTGNSARSQIAEGLLKYKTGGELEIFSAGVEPRPLNPLAIEVMKEIDVDISHHRSKDVAEVFHKPFSWVITVCDSAREKCPIFPGAHVIHWDIKDPETIEDFRSVREELKGRITEFVESVIS
jgi:arsenate reductase (thioredoxin)